MAPKRLDAPGNPSFKNMALVKRGKMPPSMFLEKDWAASAEEAYLEVVSEMSTITLYSYS